MEFVSPCGGSVGDVMNATTRVESLAKYYGLLMLTTRECCADSFRLSLPVPTSRDSLNRRSPYHDSRFSNHEPRVTKAAAKCLRRI